MVTQRHTHIPRYIFEPYIKPKWKLKIRIDKQIFINDICKKNKYFDENYDNLDGNVFLLKKMKKIMNGNIIKYWKHLFSYKNREIDDKEPL